MGAGDLRERCQKIHNGILQALYYSSLRPSSYLCSNNPLHHCRRTESHLRHQSDRSFRRFLEGICTYSVPFPQFCHPDRCLGNKAVRRCLYRYNHMMMIFPQNRDKGKCFLLPMLLRKAFQSTELQMFWLRCHCGNYLRGKQLH